MIKRFHGLLVNNFKNYIYINAGDWTQTEGRPVFTDVLWNLHDFASLRPFANYNFYTTGLSHWLAFEPCETRGAIHL